MFLMWLVRVRYVRGRSVCLYSQTEPIYTPILGTWAGNWTDSGYGLHVRYAKCVRVFFQLGILVSKLY